MSEKSGNGKHPFEDAAVIYSYSRAQAIEDGELIDVSTLAKEAGFKYPVAVTRAVHGQIVVPPEAAVGESEAGRLWDILWMLRVAIAKLRSNHPNDRLYFQVLATDEHQRKTLHRLWSVCGPGDTAEPVITIMLQGED